MRCSTLSYTLSFLIALTTACYDDSASHLYRRSSDPAGNGTEWNYDAFTGPLNWHALDPKANALCAIGKKQTPINLNAAIKSEPGSNYKLHIPQQRKAVFENKGHTLEVNELEDATLVFGEANYTLAQFHLHTPSEHRIEDEYSPLEMHFVHKTTDGKISVLAFLIELHRLPTHALHTILRHASSIKQRDQTVALPSLDLSIFAAHLERHPVYRYEGSLTTPPCTEGVQWVVSHQPLKIDYNTFNLVKGIVKWNARGYLQSAPGEENLILNAADTAKDAKRREGKN